TFQASGGFQRRRNRRLAQWPRAPLPICLVRHPRSITSNETANGYRKSIPSQMRVEFVVQSSLAGHPSAQGPGEGSQSAQGTLLGIALGSHRSVGPEYLADKVGERNHREAFVRGAESVEVLASQRGQIP